MEKKKITFLESTHENHTGTLKKILKLCYVILFMSDKNSKILENSVPTKTGKKNFRINFDAQAPN